MGKFIPVMTTVRHLEEEVDTGHPLNEKIRVLKWVTAFPYIHPGKMGVPLVYEFQGEIELASLNESFIIYSPITSIYMRMSPSRSFRHN